MIRLGEDFYQRPTVEVAQGLLGKLLVRDSPEGRASGIIVEVEAYLSENDQASHSYVGETNRNRSMFQKPGTLYVYSIHAKFCMNIVTEAAGVGAAVLIRAIEPVEGLELIRKRRGEAVSLRDLTRGPARSCQALALDRTLDGIDLTNSKDVWIEDVESELELASFRIQHSQRIGISKDQDLPLRFFVDGNRFVSGCSSCHSQPNRNRFFHRT